MLPTMSKHNRRSTLQDDWHNLYGDHTPYNIIDTLIYSVGRHQWANWCKVICEQMNAVTMEYHGMEVNRDFKVEDLMDKYEEMSRPVAYTLVRACVFAKIMNYRYPDVNR